MISAADHAASLTDPIIMEVRIQLGLHRHRRHKLEIMLGGASQVKLVVEFLNGLSNGIAAYVFGLS